MTTDQQRFNALRDCREKLERVLDKVGGFPTNAEEQWQYAYKLLKHFPEPAFIDKLEKQAKQIKQIDRILDLWGESCIDSNDAICRIDEVIEE